MTHRYTDNSAAASGEWFRIEQANESTFNVTFTENGLKLLRFDQAHIISYVGTDRIDLVALEGVIADALFAAKSDRRIGK